MELEARRAEANANDLANAEYASSAGLDEDEDMDARDYDKENAEPDAEKYIDLDAY